MSYNEYIKDKLSITDNCDVIDKAIVYIGDSYPKMNLSRKGYQIVDDWLNLIQKKWNIEYKILDLSKSSFLGNIEPKSKGFIVNLNKNLFTTQKRFTIAHEIAHILSYDIFSSNWPTYEVSHSKVEEIFCDRFARALLLPKTLIDFSKFDLYNLDIYQVSEIKRLWPEFKVAPWQIIKKLFDDVDCNSIIGILWEFFPNEDCFKIIEHYKPDSIFIPKHDRAFLDTIFKKKKTNFAPQEAYEKEFYEGYDIIEVGSLYKKRLYTIAFSIRTSYATYIIQLIKI